MSKRRDPEYLSIKARAEILDALIAGKVAIIAQLAQSIEAAATALGREPLGSEEAAIRRHRVELRKYLERRHRLSCAMHTDQSP